MNINSMNYFTKQQVEAITDYFHTKIGFSGFFRCHHDVGTKHPRKHLVDLVNILEVFMYKVLHNLGYGLEPTFHHYEILETSPFLLFEHAPKLGKSYFYAFIPAS